MIPPPHDAKAERALLGSILIDAAQGIKHLRSVEHIITSPDFFYLDNHRVIWRAMLEIGDGLDAVTLLSKLSEAGHLDKIGGQAYLLAEVIGAVATSAHVEHYSKIVASRYYEREIIASSRSLALDPEPEKIEPVRKWILLREGLTAPVGGSIEDITLDLCEALDNHRLPTLYHTHYKLFDDVWHGCYPGEVNVWAGAPNAGKSVTLLNLMLRAAKTGTGCLYFGTEMNKNELVQRMIPMVGGPYAYEVRKGQGPNYQKRYADACAALSGLPIIIVDNPAPTLADIESSIAQAKAKVVYLDYLEQFSMPRAENLRLKITEFMRELKILARKMDVVINLAAQLSRGSYSGSGNDAPKLSMLSESSAIEKVADRVVLFWTPLERQKEAEAFKSLKEYATAKNRHGRAGESGDLILDGQTLMLQEKI